ncbi:M3 family metallopeptidase [Marinihelvus fidelis]|uniref:M3 family metallopeptidase n=1 Tax=Marinihelvus fidelis TaxID=2613842 RepID=A0A5N0TGU8_9GAMM|nr:M3 family metallopeptidase [Marinihelvus fidelis]KAA9133357.1 M3 family metallopeptidase [Marinihelvus fidelis]
MKIRTPLAMAVAIAISAAACSKPEQEQAATPESDTATTAAAETPTTTEAVTETDANPFLAASPLYLGYPQFDKIDDADYLPAFEQGMKEQLVEIQAIADNPEAPTFDNTFVAMERSGQTLDRVSRVFFAMVSAHTNDAINEARAELAPKLSAHGDAIQLNGPLFERIKTVHDNVDALELDPESKRLVEETYRDFVRAGAQLNDEQKEQLKALNAELATLTTEFSQNVLKEVNGKAIVVESAEELAGLTDTEIASAKEAAEAREMGDKWVIPLLNTSQQPSLASLENRELRQRIMETSLGRGSSGGEFDNREVLTKVARLRAERAALLGYANHAAYQLEDQTARTVEAVNERLASLAPPAVANARKEAADLQAVVEAEGGDFEITAADWDFYTEKVRQQKFDFDAGELKPYLEMNNVLENGVFFAAGQVYGLTFEPRPDLPVYHPDVKVWEVFDADGSTLGLFIGDFYARESKRGGAWMNAYVSQSGLMGTQPVVANHQNIPKPPEGEPTLMTWTEVTTMFHEFGHALHGLFSNVKYPSFSGTSVPRDFVEYPSQVNEMWADWPEVLANYAVHYQTGEAIPQELLDKVLASSKFNQGYATTEYLAAALLDQAWHQRTADEIPDADGALAFEAQALADAGVDYAPVPPRYRSTYFSHIMGGYSAGYYAYIWSEVLDADTVEWFKENGGMSRENGDHFRATLLSRGGSEDAMALFQDFRGRAPDVQPLLVRRGLVNEED